MSDDSSSVNDDPDLNAGALERWVADMAEQKAVSEQELLDEVLSSYWVLEELADILVAHSSDDIELERQDSPTADRTNQPTTDQQNNAQNTANRRNDVSDNESVDVSGLKHELTELRTAIEQISEQGVSEQNTHTETRSQSADLAELLTKISSLQSSETAQPAKHNTVAETPHTEQGGRSTPSTNVTQADQSTAGPADSTVAQRVDDVETHILDLESEFSEKLSELEQRVSSNNEPDADFQSEINAEFEEIESVLDHLLEVTSDIDNRLDSVSQTHQAELSQLQEYRSTQRKLETLKSDAIKHGVSSASCGACSQTIDLSLLETPFCPACDATLSDVSPGSWVPFDSATLHTDSETPPKTEKRP